MEGINGMNYFNEDRFKDLSETPKDIKPLLKDKMYLISGDFYGIQKFIFDRLSTKNASKVIRAKSAFIQIFTEFLTKYICSELKIDEEKYILSKNAGKFEILAPLEEVDIDSIQKRIDDYFINNFYGLSGVMLSKVNCSKEDFEPKENYKKLRKEIINGVENKKFQKFNLKDSVNILEYDTNIDNQSLCKICNIRKIVTEDRCKICNNFVKLGQKLAHKTYKPVKAKDLGIDFDGFNPKLELTDKIKSYVLYNDDNTPVDFKTLAENSCSDTPDRGVEALAILKADVDNMGKFLEKSDVTDSFESFDKFSKTMDNFFSLYIPKMMKEKYPDTYTVFAGGDDLFLLGAWDEILQLARIIRGEFKSFVKDNTLSISFGIAIAKPTTPISYLAEYTEKLLKEAKEIDGKDAISLFGETVKWKEYNNTYKKLEKLFKGFDESVNTTTLYKLLIFCDMAKNIKQDIRNTMWKSKLNYLFSRNIDKRFHYILGDLNDYIEKCPQATKMFLSEFIYKRRKS